nr:unnamed protein product [Callosobruchus analis]
MSVFSFVPDVEGEGPGQKGGVVHADVEEEAPAEDAPDAELGADAGPREEGADAKADAGPEEAEADGAGAGLEVDDVDEHHVGEEENLDGVAACHGEEELDADLEGVVAIEGAKMWCRMGKKFKNRFRKRKRIRVVRFRSGKPRSCGPRRRRSRRRRRRRC